MTIAITLKVNDGLVLAADSASTLFGKDPQGNSVILKVYDNANKVFNLHKKLPVGALTWGAGSIGKASIGTLAKDFRKLISTPGTESHTDPENYTVEQLARSFKQFMYDEHYVAAFKDYKEKPGLGLLVAGYSSGKTMAEEWRIDIGADGVCQGPIPVRGEDTCGISWMGQPEAIHRLYFGVDPRFRDVMLVHSIDPKVADQILAEGRNNLKVQMVWDPMPIQDAIELARFLVELTKQYSRFNPGAETVGGPVELAAITKHEGFKWVSRKYYYDSGINPGER